MSLVELVPWTYLGIVWPDQEEMPGFTSALVDVTLLAGSAGLSLVDLDGVRSTDVIDLPRGRRQQLTVSRSPDWTPQGLAIRATNDVRCPSVVILGDVRFCCDPE